MYVQGFQDEALVFHSQSFVPGKSCEIINQ